MALVKCPECKKKISETVKNCPNCGYELKMESETKDEKNKISFIGKYKKIIIIGIILIILVVVACVVFNYFKDKKYTENKKDYPDIEMVRDDVKKAVQKELEEITLNGEKLDLEYDASKIKEVEFYEETSTQVQLKFNYNVDKLISFDIPFIVAYDFDGTDYEYASVNEHFEIEGYSNVKISSCDEIMDEDGITRDKIIEENYKTKYDSIELKDTKNDDNICVSTYEATKDGKYIDRNDTIEIKHTVTNPTGKEFKVVSANNLNTDVKFDLVGKYSGSHVTRGYFHDKSTVNFEITKVDITSLYLGKGGKINEGGSVYTLVAEDAYIESTDYDYYTMDIGFKYGTDASGVDRDLTVRIYDDKLLYYCSHSDDDTDGCYELKRK